MKQISLPDIVSLLLPFFTSFLRCKCCLEVLFKNSNEFQGNWRGNWTRIRLPFRFSFFDRVWKVSTIVRIISQKKNFFSLRFLLSSYFILLPPPIRLFFKGVNIVGWIPFKTCLVSGEKFHVITLDFPQPPRKNCRNICFAICEG